LNNWKNANVIIQHYPILIYERPGFPVNNAAGAQIQVMKAPLLEISATHIRQLILEGKSIKYLVPEEVEKEILESRFYKKPQTR
jgi:nicotinate-nucleotide adenylyltransferase